MINPLNADHRQRLAQAVDYSYQELKRYGRMRHNTIQAYLGVNPKIADWQTDSWQLRYRQTLPQGNLLQQAGLSLQIALAYGEPEFLVTPRVPEHQGMADELGPALNRMSKLLNLGDVARNVAADSYFGYGIFKVGVGIMPKAAQVATGLRVGPCVWRVSQDNFLYDITASSWDEVAYVGDMYPVPLEVAQEIYPHAADRLQSFTDTDQLNQPHVVARPSRFHSPELVVWLCDVYLPDSGAVATWPIRNESFGTLGDDPIAVREYDGHWSGVYQVLNHLYCPDELVPIAQAESTKAMHFLFNDLMHLTSDQALNAKVNPIYQTGSERDMQRLIDAPDRRPVGLSNLNNVENFEIPGPTGSQTNYLAVLYNFFKEFTPTVDEPQRAPTATQGTLERQTTNAIVTEARRKFNHALAMVGYKLGHLLVEDAQIVLPNHRQLVPGSSATVDVTWQPKQRNARVDDFDLSIEPYSTRIRDPEQKLQLLLGLSNQILAMMAQRAQGSPINIQEALKDMAEMSGLPQLKNWYEEVDPLHQAKRQQSRTSSPRMGVGEYIRHNVSERTTAGALEQSLTQGPSENGQVPQSINRN